MRLDQHIPRNALAWMILCLAALVAPHISRIPIWVLIVYAFAALWRIQVYRGLWSYPDQWLKFALIVSAFTATVWSFGSLLGLEPMVALLLTAFALKMTELVHRKDAYVLLFLGYFICLTEFLFSQDLLLVLYMLACVWLLTTALVALHRPGQHQFNLRPARQAGVMLLQAFPLMVVLFFLFPRIGPLWTVPIKSHAAKTGVSDFMKPGDISQLSLSDEVAFRVQFEGDIPPQSQLYWRGLVFSRLLDGAWSSLSYFEIPVRERRAPAVRTEGARLDYSIIMAPTQQNWLYGLHYARSDSPGVMETADYRLHSPVIIEDEYRYLVKSWPEVTLTGDLSDWRRDVEVRLPLDANPRTLALARELRAAAASDRQYVQAGLDRFNREPYVYTLQPPALAEPDTMDQFLFQSRRGFCEHYAYAFVVLMRAADIPARVVAGYQGGEINPVNQTVVVHQFDAHAWAEVWLPGEGWVRVDPTAAVSPSRIEQGLEQALAGEGTFLANSPLSPLRYRSLGWLNQIRHRYDALTYRWQSWVVNFNSQQQFTLLQNVLGGITPGKFALVLLGAWALFLAPVAWAVLRRRDVREIRELDKLYLKLCERLAGLGIARHSWETPSGYADRVEAERPELAQAFNELTRQYNELAFEPADPVADTAGLAEFRRGVRRMCWPVHGWRSPRPPPRRY